MKIKFADYNIAIDQMGVDEWLFELIYSIPEKFLCIEIWPNFKKS